MESIKRPSLSIGANSLIETFMLKLLVLLLGCLPSRQLIEAAFLMECEGYIITTIRNPNQECSEYIHCAGDNSYYCNGDCDEAVVCNNSTDMSTAASTATTVGTTSVTREDSTSNSSVQTEGTSTQTTKVNVVPTTTQKPLPTNRPSPSPPTTPINSSDPYVICRNTNQHLVFPYPANSNYYYECISKHLLLQQCPQNFCFDVSQGQCIRRNPYRL